MVTKILSHDDQNRREAWSGPCVIPNPARCVQCGMCSYHCPAGFDVRRHAWVNEPVRDSRCPDCKECIKYCPRGALRLEQGSLLGKGGAS